MRVIESMTCVRRMAHLGPCETMCRFRIWRHEEEIRDVYDNDDLISVIRDSESSAIGIAQFVACQPRVNAVEVVDEETGNGTCIYPDWP